MVQWTEKQQAIISGLREKNLLVSAAAGSGKTTVLVERIIDLIIEDGVDIDSLLVVTFTRAAAAEMKQRIQLALEKRINHGERRQHLQRQLNRLNRAQISTIHSFCIKIVRNNFQYLDIDPGFRVGETNETDFLKEEAINRVLEDYYQEMSPGFARLVESYTSNRGDDKLADIINRVYNFTESKPYPEKWLSDSIELFNLEKDNLGENRWLKTIRESIGYRLEARRDILNDALNLCQKPRGPREYAENIKKDINLIDDLCLALKEGLARFTQYTEEIGFSRLKSIRGQRKEEVDDRLKNEVKELRDECKKGIRKIVNFLDQGDFENYIRQLKDLYPVMDILADLVLDFKEEYRKRKQERGILDFNDLEHYALRVLEEVDVRKRYREQFSYIFVDEYQDSNPVQETIINRIRRENNLFMVGDVKQSIYRFRLADPTLFLDRYNSYQKYIPAENGYGEEVRVDLARNFRSRKEILDGINLLFSHLMSETLGEIDYGEESYLYKGLDFEPVSGPTLELNIIEDNNGLEGLEELTKTEREAKITADKVKQLLGKETYLPEKGEYRELSYRDIVILLRSPGNKLEVYQNIFKEENIPLYVDDDSGFFSTLEIRIFLNLLRIIDNRRQDLPLLSVLRSSIGDFNIQELTDIRLNYRQDSFYTALIKYREENCDYLSRKIDSFMEDLNSWSDEVRYMKLSQFIWKVMQDTNFYHYVGAMPGGKNRQANLRILVDRAGEFEKTSVRGLFNFIRFIDNLDVTSGDMGTAQVIGENENVVRLMSVHKSKGLEFPVVILGDLGKGFNFQDLKGDILLHRNLGIGPRYVDPGQRVYTDSLAKIAIREKKKVETLSEEMRILYVAMTRAIDRLILIGSVNNLEKRCKKWIRGTAPHHLLNGGCYLDWIGSVLIRHRDGKTLCQKAGIELSEKGLINHKTDWQINIYDNDPRGADEGDDREKGEIEYRNSLYNFRDRKEGYSEYRAEIEKRLDWEYNYRDAVNIPSKMSVTGIKKTAHRDLEDMAYSIPDLADIPKFKEEEKGFTGAERGTIIHFVMKHINLAFTGLEMIENQLSEMVDRNLLTEKEADVVEPEKISKFFTSDLGKRLLTADKIRREAPFVLKKRAGEIIDCVENSRETIFIQGIIDCYFVKDGKITLIDYKTDKMDKRGIEEIKKRYRYQIDIYREALASILNQEVTKSYLYLFEPDRVVEIGK